MVETSRFSESRAQDRIEPDLKIDGFFARLASGESPKAEELDLEYLKLILFEAGANFDVDLEKAKERLSKKKYENRRDGLVLIWGENTTTEFEDWAQEVSVLTCPKFGGKYGDESRSFGLKQMLAELTNMVVGGLDADDFARRTAKRVKFGMAYPTVKKSENPEEYTKQRAVYEALKGDSELSNIPPHIFETFWRAVRSGNLFPAD